MTRKSDLLIRKEIVFTFDKIFLRIFKKFFNRFWPIEILVNFIDTVDVDGSWDETVDWFLSCQIVFGIKI